MHFGLNENQVILRDSARRGRERKNEKEVVSHA